MNPRAEERLRLYLELTNALGADVLRLAVGPAVAFVKETRHVVGQWPLQAFSVEAIHDECLFIAKRPDLLGKQECSYTMAMPGLGTWHCQISNSGPITLTLRRGRKCEGDEALVDSGGLPPALANNAKCEPEPDEGPQQQT